MDMICPGNMWIKHDILQRKKLGVLVSVAIPIGTLATTGNRGYHLVFHRTAVPGPQMGLVSDGYIVRSYGNPSVILGYRFDALECIVSACTCYIIQTVFVPDGDPAILCKTMSTQSQTNKLPVDVAHRMNGFHSLLCFTDTMCCCGCHCEPFAPNLCP